MFFKIRVAYINVNIKLIKRRVYCLRNFIVFGLLKQILKELMAKKKRGRYIVNTYSVIEIVEEDIDDRLFECIPDSWFVDETKGLCFWPPTSGNKSFSLLALNCERPDEDTWIKCECKVISGGHCKFLYLWKMYVY